MKVELITPEVEKEIRITLSNVEARVLTQRLGETRLMEWFETAKRVGLPESVGENLNNIYYKLSDIL